MSDECPYCNYPDQTGYTCEKIINKHSDSVDVYVDPSGELDIDSEFESLEIQINYCPMCGRRINND